MSKKQYDIKKTLEKGGINLVVVLLSGVLVVYSNQLAALSLIPLVTMALNYLKHRKKNK